MAPIFPKTQVKLFDSIIDSKLARIHKPRVKKLLAIAFLGPQAKNQKQTKKLRKAGAGLLVAQRLIWQGFIITHLEVDLVIYHLTYLIKHTEQHFKSIFQINLLNQPIQSTYWRCHELVVHCFLKHTYVGGSTFTYRGTYDLSGKFSGKSLTYQSVRCITLEYLLVLVLMKALLDAAKTSPLCGRQLYLSWTSGYWRKWQRPPSR